MYLRQAPEHLKSSISFICIGCKRQTFNPVHDKWQIKSCVKVKSYIYGNLPPFEDVSP